jgi:hypothetical protein
VFGPRRAQLHPELAKAGRRGKEKEEEGGRNCTLVGVALVLKF